MRLFVAVDPGEEFRLRAADVLATGRTLAPGAKWVRAENLHLTLAFMGSIPDDSVPGIAAALASVAERHGPVSLHVAGAGGFGSPKKPRVLWLGITGDLPALSAIRDELQEALVPFGHEPERRDFRPHLTIARARDPRGDPTLAAAVAGLEKTTLGEARIERLILFRSELSSAGPRYTELASAPLSAALPPG